MNEIQVKFDTLQKEMRACSICKQEGFFVQPPAVTQGVVTAKMMTIGQAPGITEVEAKRPFNDRLFYLGFFEVCLFFLFSHVA